MSIDINFPIYGNPGGQEIDTSGNLVYWWYCAKCQNYHNTPWCPNWDYESPVMDSSDTMKKLPRICPHCGQVMRK